MVSALIFVRCQQDSQYREKKWNKYSEFNALPIKKALNYSTLKGGYILPTKFVLVFL